MNKPETAHWIEKDRQQLHPVYHPKSHLDPLVVDHGEGVWLYTTDGQKILDGMAGLWNVNVGYGNEELAKAAYDQMKRMAFTSNFAGMTNLPSILLADKLAGFAYEGLNTTFFASGGSEANDSAFKTARYYWKRKGKPAKTKIIARKGAYHGVTMYATFATGLEKYHTMFGPAIPDFIHRFALKHWNVKPDILSFAKAVTSGYAQLGGIQISDEIRETIETASEGEAYMHGYTYSGHAMACAVGLKNLEIMERENFPARAKNLGKRLLAGLQTLKEFPFVGDVRGLGLVCGVEIVADKATKTPDPALAMRIFKAAQAHSLRSRPLGATLAFAPPLVISEEEVDEIVKRLGAAMDGIR